METDELGQTYLSSKELYLPQGKKPVIITQTQVNYNTYMVDGDGDKLPDKDGDGQPDPEESSDTSTGINVGEDTDGGKWGAIIKPNNN